MSILYHLENYTKIIEKPLGILTSGTTDCGNGVYLLKAGTPISNAGAVANTGDAKYLVEEDFYFYSNTPTQPKVVKLIEKGYVDLGKAEAAAGITYADAAKTALATAGVILVDGKLAEGGSSGSGVLVAHATVAELPEPGAGPVIITLDKTVAELMAAETCAVEIAFSEPDSDVTVLLMRDFSIEGSESQQLGFSGGDAVVEAFGCHLVASCLSDSGIDVAALIALPASPGNEPFVLHGTLTSETTGTITESISDLLAAVQANKEIILEFAMDGETIRMSMPTRATRPSGNNTHVSVSNLFQYSASSSTHYMLNVAVYSNEGYTALVMGATYFTATPVT